MVNDGEKKLNSPTQDHNHHIAEAGPHGQLDRTLHRTCCQAPARPQPPAHGGQSGYVGRQLPRNRPGPR